MISAALPLTGYLAHEMGLIQTAQAQEESDEEAVNPRAEYWRAVRGGSEGYSAVSGPEAGVLIQNGGQNWRAIRNGPISFYGGSLIIVVLLALLAKHIVRGRDKLESRTGRTITRWSAFERIMHWYVAISFIVLAITGLSLIFGRTLLIPILGKEGFAAWAALAKPVHDYLALPFAAGLTLLMLMWIGKNFPKSYDLKWLMSLGGAIGDGHPPAGFFNAGEKVFFWLIFSGGVVMTLSGLSAVPEPRDGPRVDAALAHPARVLRPVPDRGCAWPHLSRQHRYRGRTRGHGEGRGRRGLRQAAPQPLVRRGQGQRQSRGRRGGSGRIECRHDLSRGGRKYS
jgi:formate dehydrogenase subunit gamma